MIEFILGCCQFSGWKCGVGPLPYCTKLIKQTAKKVLVLNKKTSIDGHGMRGMNETSTSWYYGKLKTCRGLINERARIRTHNKIF